MRVVRLDTPQQGVDIEHLTKLHHTEFGQGREFDVKAISRSCLQCVEDKERKRINGWIAYSDSDKPVGYLAGSMHWSFYSFREYAVQEMWYVIPSHRGTLAAALLVDQFELWARERNAERIYMQVEHDDNQQLVDRVFKFMTLFGYKKQGYIAVKVLRHTDKHTDKHEDKDDDCSAHSTMGADKTAQ